MKATKKYLLEEQFEEGYVCFDLVQSASAWKLKVHKESPAKPTLYTMANTASSILSNKCECLKRHSEVIDSLVVFTEVAGTTEKFELCKGFSTQRILEEITKKIRVNN